MAPALPRMTCRRPRRPTRSSEQVDRTAKPRPIAPGREILVIHPLVLEEGEVAIEAVRRGQTVLLDASGMERSLGQRLVDFTSGGVKAMDGQARRIGPRVFLFTAAICRIENDPPQL
jgi:cell division inhibitor SepF